MKITRVEPIHLRLPYTFGGRDAVPGTGGTRATIETVLVRVETDQGLTGWGEAFGFAATPLTLAAIRDVVAPLAAGHDADDIAALMDGLKRRLQNMMRGGPARFALSGLDIALWDIRGQARGEPIWRMLGGKGRKDIAAYASLWSLPTAERTAEVAADAAAHGYRHVKLHQKTPEAVAAARTAVGPNVSLMVDVNCAFTLDEAVALARAVAPFDVTWLEEPISPTDDYDALARLRGEGGVPIAIGENLGNPLDFRWAGRFEAADIAQPSVVKIGGIGESWRAIAIARDAGMRVCPHSPFVGPGLAATIHLIAAMDEETPCEHRYCALDASPLGAAAEARDGRLSVPQEPGLGVTVDEDVIARYRAA